MNYSRFIDPSPLSEQQRLSGIEVTEEAKKKRPPKREINALVAAFAAYQAVQKSGASIAVQMRKSDAYNKKLTAMTEKYPHVDMWSSKFHTGMENAAKALMKKEPLKYSGLPGVSY